jgi:hypothetical protein
MKLLYSLLLLITLGCKAAHKETVYQGSTPPHAVTREFLGISLTDSIDFIRWKLIIRADQYELDCQYGLGKAGTNGFTNTKTAVFSGKLIKQDHYYSLVRDDKTLLLFEVNSNLLHLVDHNKNLLIGDGGFSYVLNNTNPSKSKEFNYHAKQSSSSYLMAFQGRTPCHGLPATIRNTSSGACEKLKWYIILFTDSISGKPSYYLEGGRSYKKESMTKGSWQILRKEGRTIYKLETEKRAAPFYLLRADDTILFFTDAEGNLLVGDEDFSYTLNRTEDREPK